MDFDYFVFIDSDIVILDMGMNLEEIIDRNAWADMIFSRDSQPENGIMNSGTVNIYNYLFR
jgi:hypothetical protein